MNAAADQGSTVTCTVGQFGAAYTVTADLQGSDENYCVDSNGYAGPYDDQGVGYTEGEQCA
jgi:hypothetical protein